MLWKILSRIIELSLVVLLLAIIFAPLQLLSSYGMKLLFGSLGLGLVLLLRSGYHFIQDIPKRRAADSPKNTDKIIFGLKWKTWKSIIEWTITIIIVLVVIQYQRGSIGSAQCPDLVRGNLESSVTLQYFYSPFCPACWRGENILQTLIEKYPKIRFENYDKRYCKEEMSEAGVRGSPSYYITNGTKTDTVYRLDKEQIERALCTIGDCS